MAGAQHPARSPEWGLNSRSTAPVRGDYRLSQKNEILLDLFLNTLFHPPTPPPPLPSFLPTNFSTSFFCPSFLRRPPPPLPTGSAPVRGQVRGHQAAPEREQPGNKGLGCCPPPPARPLKKTPTGMLQWVVVVVGWGGSSPLKHQRLDAVMS